MQRYKLITVTFSPLDNTYKFLYDMLDDYRTNISGKLSLNYQKERFNLDNMEALSVTYDNDRILFFSSIFRRPDWHPSVVRLLNRTYKDESVRVTSGNAFDKMKSERPITTLLQDQFAFASDLKYTNFIISREHNSTNMLKFYTKWCTETTKLKWELNTEKVWTCPSQYGNSCHQNIIYSSINDDFDPKTMLSY